MSEDFIEKRRKLWEGIEAKYPDIDKILKETQKKIDKADEEFMEMFDFLEEHYQVEGYEWSIEPNDRKITLDSKEAWAQMEKDTDEKLKKQYKCVEGVHHFKEINGMKWCSYCGTLVDSENRLVPEHPHFVK